MAGEWYRKKSWSPADQADFFGRLQRCRSNRNRAQYLRIQASYLQKLGTKKMLREALLLLERVLYEFPEKFQLAMIYYQKAKCLEHLGETEQALASYRSALDAERALPNIKTDAWLAFGWLVIRKHLVNSYNEAVAVLNEFKRPLNFPAERYNCYGILAVISAQKNDYSTAKKFATTALDAASAKHSGFRYHPSIGLVENPEKDIYTTLNELAVNLEA